MEKLTKSTNGQWKLIKVADEVKNRRAEQASRMAEQGQGDIKANTSESIYNIPKEAKDFNPHIHLYHPQAPDELHRLNQDEWNSHFQNMMNDDRLTSDQLSTLNVENTRRQNVMDFAAQQSGKKNRVFDPRARKRGESNIDYAARIKRDYGDVDNMSPEDRERFHQEFNLSAEKLAEREHTKSQQQSEEKRLIDKKAEEIRKIKQKEFEDARDSLVKRLPIADESQMSNLYRRILQEPALAQKISRYLHVIHEVKPDGTVKRISFHPKGSEKETAQDFISLMRGGSGDDVPHIPNQFIGLEESHPHLFPEKSTSRPLAPIAQQPDPVRDIVSAGTGVGAGTVLTDEQKQKIHASQYPEISAREKEKNRDRIERSKKRHRRLMAEARREQQEAEKHK